VIKLSEPIEGRGVILTTEARPLRCQKTERVMWWMGERGKRIYRRQMTNS